MRFSEHGLAPADDGRRTPPGAASGCTSGTAPSCSRTTSSRTSSPSRPSSREPFPSAARAAAPRPMGRHEGRARRFGGRGGSAGLACPPGDPRDAPEVIIDASWYDGPRAVTDRRRESRDQRPLLGRRSRRVPRHPDGWLRRRASRGRRLPTGAELARLDCVGLARVGTAAALRAFARSPIGWGPRASSSRTAARAMGRPAIDLLDPHFHVGDPHPAYRWMREQRSGLPRRDERPLGRHPDGRPPPRSSAAFRRIPELARLPVGPGTRPRRR